jgi:hypothetical protein
VGDWTHPIGPPTDGSKYVTVVKTTGTTTVVPVKIERLAREPVDATVDFNEAARQAAKALVDQGNALHRELFDFKETFAEKVSTWIAQPGLKDEAREAIARGLRECAGEFNRLADFVQVETQSFT